MKYYFLTNKLTLSLIICSVVIILALIFNPTFTKLRELQTHYSHMKQKLILEEKENQRLKAELDGLAHDPSWIEKVAREKLGWCSPEETVYRFQTSDSNN